MAIRELSALVPCSPSFGWWANGSVIPDQETSVLEQDTELLIAPGGSRLVYEWDCTLGPSVGRTVLFPRYVALNLLQTVVLRPDWL